MTVAKLINSYRVTNLTAPDTGMGALTQGEAGRVAGISKLIGCAAWCQAPSCSRR